MLPEDRLFSHFVVVVALDREGVDVIDAEGRFIDMN
jgi:hypothetical protein